MNFTSLGVAVIAGLALVVGALVGLASAVLSPRVQGWIDRERRIDERAFSDWSGRRDVYAELLTQLGTVMAAADGAVAGGRRHGFPAEEIAAMNRAEVAAELRAPATAWAEMQPYVRAVALCANAVSPSLDGPTRQRIDLAIKALGADDDEGRAELRRRFVAAVRVDLGPEPPGAHRTP